MVDVNSVGSAGSSSWLRFLKEIKHEHPQLQQPQQLSNTVVGSGEEIISDITSLSDDTNLVYSAIDSSVNNSTNNSRINDTHFIDSNQNSNISGINQIQQPKDQRNSWLFNEYPDISIFNIENNVRSRNSSFAQSTPNTPLMGSANKENGYLRKLALKKNRFSMDNQDHNTSLKLKMASDEIDKLIFFLNTPRDLNDNGTSNNSCSSSTITKSTNNCINNKLSILEEEEEEEEGLAVKDQLPIIEQKDFKRISQSLEIIHNNNSNNYSSSKRKCSNKVFWSISSTFMKLDDDYSLESISPINSNSLVQSIDQQSDNRNGGRKENYANHLYINNEIKMDPLIEISIESEMVEGECPICCLEIEGMHNVFTFSPCQHRYCVDCIRKYFTDLIFRQMEIQCPDPKCDSIVHDLKIKDLVGNIIYKRYEIYKYFKNSKNDYIIFCEECQNPIPYKSLVSISSTSQKNTVTCETCKSEHCIECFSLSHPEKSCKDNQKHIRDNLTPDELKTLKYMEDNQIKRCPRCGVYSTKTDGCEYVICLNCNYQFCFLCLEPHDHNLSTHVHGPRYQEENPVLLDNLHYVHKYQKRKKAKNIAKNVLYYGGIIAITPVCIAAAAVAAVPYLIYVLAKKNQKKKKEKKKMKYNEWASNEYKRRQQNGQEISPYIEQAANNYTQKKNKKK